MSGGCAAGQVEHLGPGWRDLSKTKWRLVKGDEQLDATYNGSETPHHISDELMSELAYTIYKVRFPCPFLLTWLSPGAPQGVLSVLLSLLPLLLLVFPLSPPLLSPPLPWAPPRVPLPFHALSSFPHALTRARAHTHTHAEA